MRGILASYRWRRRLAWITTTVVLVAGAVTVGLKWPNTVPKDPAVANVPANIDYSSPKPVRLKPRDRATALAVVVNFIDAAVLGKNLDRSWNLVSPEFRAGFTRKQWSSGEIPVVPFPVEESKWKLDYSDSEGVGFQFSLKPTKRSHMHSQVFLVGLHKLGTGKGRHWVVDLWQPAPTSAASSTGGGGGGGTQLGARFNPMGESRLSAAWLLLPLGLLSLIVLVPLGIVSVNWFRGHRADRALQRS